MHRFYPPQRFLMGLGPSEISLRLLQAQARATISHLDPAFQALRGAADEARLADEF